MASLEKLVFPIQNAGLLFTEHALHSPDGWYKKLKVTVKENNS